MAETLLLIAITTGVALAILLMLFLVEWARRGLKARRYSIPGILEELKIDIDDFKAMPIGRARYATGFANGRRVVFKLLDKIPQAARVGSLDLEPISVRIKLRETERSPIHLEVLPEGDRPDPEWTRLDGDVFLGGLSGVSPDLQRRVYARLSAVTIQALRNLARQSATSVSVGPDWDVNVIGRDAVLRLLGQDGVAITQMQLTATLLAGQDYSLKGQLRQMERAADLLEKEMP